ncbi:TonB-dependent receptor [Litoribacter alkaliphilus]|uniref:TonB-dependent receptor n=1 Tax=Litoribacter ruber TaxID=702568 RepID=A0AAP2CGY9_9BACT|nr:outer membrane beta-barrel protein [Litoribacter alkaliphilus]MBS9524548.1 TonB-dependent receptor [Litoribacter alkaliphilus]
MKASTIFIFYMVFFINPILGEAKIKTQISGQVMDSQGVALPFANVALVEVESEKLITGTVSEDNGKFDFSTSQKGTFQLKVTSIGFQPFLSDPFEVENDESRDFGKIVLQEETADLGEVTVRSSRPEVIIQADKTIVNVEGTVMAEGSTALDVIGRSPGVYVDSDGNINLNGRSGVIVLIDDRQTYMSAADLANFLRSMPADNIKSIEVINSPSSRYDAEGSGGVINIRLKKNTMNGVNGSVQVGHQYNGLNTPFTGATVNVRSGKWTTNASLNYNEWARIIDLDIYRRFQVEGGLSNFDQEANINIRRRNLFFNGGADYQINDKHSVGMSIQASGSDGPDRGLSLTNISNPNTADLNFLEAVNNNETNSQRIFTNLHYIGNLDTLGTKITSDIDITRMETGSLGFLDNSYWLNERVNQESDRIRTDNDMLYTIYTAKVDFTKPFKNGNVIETGIKGSWVRSDNNLDIQRGVTGELLRPDPNSNMFIYNENVLAGYVNYKGKFSDKFEYQAGLRGEHSDITGNSVTLNQVNEQRYFDLFPSAFLKQNVSENYNIVYNYNRRITRPNYRLLNPFVFYVDPLTTERGNPNLQPQYAQNFEMSHNIKNAYQITLAYGRITNSFNQIMSQNEETRESVFQVQNLDRADNFSLRFTLPFELTEWWSTSNMLQVYYNRFQSPLGDEMLDMEQWSGMVRTQHNITLPKGFKMEIMGLYLSPFLEGQAKIRGVGWVDAGVTKSFKDDKISLTVNATDVFRTQVFRVNVLFDQIDTSVQQYNSNQAIRFTLRYKFNRGENFNVRSRSGSSEEQQRLE